MQGILKKFLIGIFAVQGVRSYAQLSLKYPSSSMVDSSNKLNFNTFHGNLLPLGSSSQSNLPSFRIASDLVVKNFAFFCKTEWKFEKKTSIPFKFRLGSVEQTDYWEGKTKARKY